MLHGHVQQSLIRFNNSENRKSVYGGNINLYDALPFITVGRELEI